ncbi:hypothetical protein VXS06_14870 [Photobacterium toruni]|uniref:Uncharacterized protein n=1 Tax=Photobacterium toruni TaxID=1935446 RepID=A0ABU6L8Y9_9GAMM|nr:hypothetical protein [Photobacterium toruni]
MKFTSTELDTEIDRLNSIISDDSRTFADKEREIELILDATNDEYQKYCISMLHERLINEFGEQQ